MGRRILIYAAMFLFLSNFLNNNEYIFYGRVIDAEGLPLANVRIEYKGGEEEINPLESTDDNGSFHITEFDSTDCSGTFIADYLFRLDGYKAYRLFEREVEDGEEVEMTIILENEDSELESRQGDYEDATSY